MKVAGRKTAVPNSKSKRVWSRPRDHALAGLLTLSFLSTPLFADSIERRLDDLENQLYELLQQRPAQNSGWASTQAKLDHMEAELRLLTGNLESQGVQRQHSEAGLQRRYQDIDLRLSALERQIHLMDTSLSRALKQIAPQLEKERQAYQQGLTHLQGGNAAEALKKFSQFKKLYPKSPLAAEADFWIGEAHFASGNYAQAIKEYQKYVTAEPLGELAARVLLQQGIAFLNLDMKKEGRPFFVKLVKEHPESEEAKAAQRQIDLLDGKPVPPEPPPIPALPTDPGVVDPVDAMPPLPGVPSDSVTTDPAVTDPRVADPKLDKTSEPF